MLNPGRKISVPHRLEDGQTAVSDVFQFLVFNALERLDAKLLVLFELGLVFRLISVVVLRHLPPDDGMKDMIEMPIEFLRASMAEMQRDFLEEETGMIERDLSQDMKKELLIERKRREMLVRQGQKKTPACSGVAREK